MKPRNFFKRFRKKPGLFRHGDLLIRKVPSIPKTAIPTSTNVIAEGEKTGHNHQLVGSHQIFETGEATYFEAKQELSIEHPEHNTIQIPKGIYKVAHEQSWNPFLIREEDVAD